MNHNVTSLIICLRNALPETYHLLHLSDLLLRKTAKPNTFAIIASDYYDHISLLPISDEWENIYHLLIRAQSD